MAIYTLDAGRCIVRDGKPLATIHAVRDNDSPMGYDPREMDALARMTVAALNLCQRLEACWPEALDDREIKGTDAVESLVEFVKDAVKINAGCRP